MQFSDMFKTTSSIQGTSIEDYTDILALAFNAINIRSSDDRKYILNSSLFGHAFGVKPIGSSAVDFSSLQALGVSDAIVQSSETNEVAKIGDADTSTIGIKINMLDSDTAKQDKVFRQLLLHKHTCSGLLISPPISSLIDSYNESQLFWRRYRLIKDNINSLSFAKLNANRNFTMSSDFATNSLSLPDVFTIGNMSNCLFSEGGSISFANKYVPCTNELDTVYSVSFDYTVCEIV